MVSHTINMNRLFIESNYTPSISLHPIESRIDVEENWTH